MQVKQVTIRLPWPLWEQLEPKAKPEGINAVVTTILQDHLAAEQHQDVMMRLAKLRARTHASGYVGDAVEDVRALRQSRWDES